MLSKVSGVHGVASSKLRDLWRKYSYYTSGLFILKGLFSEADAICGGNISQTLNTLFSSWSQDLSIILLTFLINFFNSLSL